MHFTGTRETTTAVLHKTCVHMEMSLVLTGVMCEGTQVLFLLHALRQTCVNDYSRKVGLLEL